MRTKTIANRQIGELENIGLSNRTKNALYRHKIFTLDTLLNLSFNELLNLRGIGANTVREIMETITQLGEIK